MQITDAMVKDVVKKFVPGMTYANVGGVVNTLQRHIELTSTVAMAIQTRPDTVFELLRFGVGRAIGDLTTLQTQLQNALTGLDDLGRKNSPISTVAPLQHALGHLKTLEAQAVSLGILPRGALQGVQTGIDQFLSLLKPSISSGQTFRRTRTGATDQVRNAIAILQRSWTKAMEVVPSVNSAITNLSNSNVGVRAIAQPVQNIRSYVETLLSNIGNQDPSARADKGIEQFLHLIVGKDILNKNTNYTDPSQAKVSVGTVRAAGTGTGAVLRSTKSGPFHLDSTNKTFELTLNGGPNQTFTLPEASPAEILSAAPIFPLTITAPTQAALSAQLVGPYTTPVRANAVDMVSTINQRFFTSAGASFLSTVQAGDHVVLSGSLTLSTYVTKVIDNTTLMLDDVAPSSQVGITYNIYRDNRMVFTIRGTKYTVGLTVGVGVTAATWQTELSTGLGAAATVTLAGGLITVTDAGTAGQASTMLLDSSEVQSLMNFQQGLAIGVADNRNLTIATDTGTDAITLTPSTYATLNDLVTHINTLANATIWQAEKANTQIRTRSATKGQKAFLRVSVGNGALGLYSAVTTYGAPVPTDDVVKHMKDNSVLPATYAVEKETVHRGVALGTVSGSVQVTDTTADFTSIGVQVGDTLLISSGNNKGYFPISVVGTTTLDLDASYWVAAGVTTEGDISYSILREYFTVTSTELGTTSSIVVGAGTANALFGFSASQEVRGKVRTLEVLKDGNIVDPQELKITTNDSVDITSPALNLDVTAVGSASIMVGADVDNNLSSTSFQIISKSAKSFNTMKSALDTWISTELPKVAGDTLNVLIDRVGRALGNPSPLYIGEAKEYLNLLNGVLFDPTNGILGKLQAYQPTKSDDTTALVRTLKDEDSGRLLDLITRGAFDTAFATQVGGDSPVQYLSQIVQAANVTSTPSLDVQERTLRGVELDDGGAS